MTLITAIGWLGNACFFSRSLVQWALSERVRRSVSPPSFWWLSLAGSLLLGAYALNAGELVLLVGFTINGAIYARNLVLLREDRAKGPSERASLPLVVVACLALLAAAWTRLRVDPDPAVAWLACALVGQALWSSRFVVQWRASERRGESHFPVAFWWISLAGNTALLAYALHLRDPVFIAGYVLGPIVQVRNLMLSHRSGLASAAS